MDSTTAQVWNAIPYQARHALVEMALAKYYHLEGDDTWTRHRICVTPWRLLTDDLRVALHTLTLCSHSE